MGRRVNKGFLLWLSSDEIRCKSQHETGKICTIILVDLT